MLSSVIVVVAGCRCCCWGTANYSFILMRGRKIGSRVPGIESGSRTFETQNANHFATMSVDQLVSCSGICCRVPLQLSVCDTVVPRKTVRNTAFREPRGVTPTVCLWQHLQHTYFSFNRHTFRKQLEIYYPKKRRIQEKLVLKREIKGTQAVDKLKEAHGKSTQNNT